MTYLRLIVMTVLRRHSGHSSVRRFRPGKSSMRITHIDVPHLGHSGAFVASKERGVTLINCAIVGWDDHDQSYAERGREAH
jgi:hypothetical protein